MRGRGSSDRGGARGGGGHRGNFSPRGGAVRGGIGGDRGRGRGARSPVGVQEWMRRIDGQNTWTPLRLADNVQNDVAQIDDIIFQVRGGAIQPQPHHNPYRMQLSSGRMLTFDWSPNPHAHVNVISNIKYNGKSKASTLWHPTYEEKPP
jgi:hypothetical protein